MSDIISPFLAELRRVEGILWPEVLRSATPPGAGIWNGPEIATLPFEDVQAAGGVFLVNDLDLRDSEDGALADKEYGGDAILQYCTTLKLMPKLVDLIAKMEAMVDYLRANDLNVGQIMPSPYPSFSAQLPANRYFADGNLPFRAVAVVAPFRIGEYQTS